MLLLLRENYNKKINKEIGLEHHAHYLTSLLCWASVLETGIYNIHVLFTFSQPFFFFFLVCVCSVCVSSQLTSCAKFKHKT